MSATGAIAARLRAWINQPEAELSRWQRFAALVAALTAHCARQLRRDRAPQMAAALSYRTLFGLIPTMVLSLIVLRFFYADSIQEPLRRVLDYVGLADVAIPAEGDSRAVGDGDERLGVWIESLIDRVSEINFAAIGAVGVAVLLYAALSLMAQVEQAFNVIYKAGSARKLIARITQYWTLLTLAPLGIVASFWINDRFRTIVQEIGGSAFVSAFGVLAAFVVSWLILLLAFKVVPNARVNLKAALLGSFVAAALWEAGKWAFGLYVGFATGYAKFYGSLGLIPIFMLWVYLTWLIVLFGLELSYAVQTLERGVDAFRDSLRSQQREQADPVRALSMLTVIAAAFEQGESMTTSEIASIVGLSGAAAEPGLRALEREGLVHQIDGPEDEPMRWALSRPPDRIEMRQVAESLLDSTDGETASSGAMRGVRDALLNGLGDRTLASMLTTSERTS